MTVNSTLVFNYVTENDGCKFIAQDIADGTGLNIKQVNGVVTAFQKKEIMERVPAEIELEDGTHKAVKFIRFTDFGRTWDPAQEEAEKAAKAAEKAAAKAAKDAE